MILMDLEGNIKMSKRTPEKLIANLRRRKLRIVCHLIAAVIFGLSVAVLGYFAFRAGTMLIIDSKTEDIETEAAWLSICGPFMALVAASFFTLCLAQFILFGSTIGTLIAELTSYTQDQLLVEMWDRIKEIQSKIDGQ